MSEASNSEFDLDQLSEAETDEELGLPEFREHFADTLAPAVLKNWSAKDFANIYVRFRPHLERHAKRFLNNSSQAEEVVQDAFLYLMTSLPELDSELGVLKFLKWKVRLLSLDVIRQNSRVSTLQIDEQMESCAADSNPTESIERAEDAAIVALALAKLQPRHREALIATLYEEKSAQDVAKQMGLTENAFRQLLFRARGSFKKALVGEADVSGRSVVEILSVASKKALKSPIVGAGLSIVAALALTFSMVSYEIPVDATLASKQESRLLDWPSASIREPSGPDADALQKPTDNANVAGLSPGEGSEGQANALLEDSTQNDPIEPEPQSTPITLDSPAEESGVSSAAFAWASSFLEDVTRIPHTSDLRVEDSRLDLELGNSSFITLLISPQESQVVSSVVLSARGDHRGLVAIPTGIHQEIVSSPGIGPRLDLVLTGFAVGDLEGKFGNEVVEDAHFSEIAISVSLEFANSEMDEVAFATASFLPRT